MPIESGEAARQSEELLEEELHGAKSTPAPVISAPSAYIVQGESITIKMDESKVRETKKEDGNAFVRWITNKAKVHRYYISSLSCGTLVATTLQSEN